MASSQSQAYRAKKIADGRWGSIVLGSLQRSIVETYLIEGGRCEDDPTLDLDAIEAHLMATGRLLVMPEDAGDLWQELIDLANQFDYEGDWTQRDSAAGLASRVIGLGL